MGAPIQRIDLRGKPTSSGNKDEEYESGQTSLEVAL